MTTKLYLHDATSSDTGTLPSAALTTTSLTVTMAGATTNRSMDTTPGSSQVAPTLASQATVSTQNNWFRRFVSAPLAAQTLGSASVPWKWQFAGATSNASNSAWRADIFYLGVWRPSTGAAVGTPWVAAFANATSNATAAEALDGPAGGTALTGVTSTINCNAGDILVLEYGGGAVQGMATSYTWTLYYDGTTDDSITSCAAYLVSPTTLTFFTAGAATPEVVSVGQAVQRASVY